MTPFVSVVVPVFQDAPGLRNCLAALIQQSYPGDRLEVIVVQDEASNLAIEAVMRDFPSAIHLRQPNAGSYAARNRGIVHAHGEVLAFTDADCIPRHDWVVEGVRALATDPRIGLVGGEVEFFFQGESPNGWELYDSITFLQQRLHVERYGFAATANLFTRRCVIDAVGLFDGRLRSGGDGEWGRRVQEAGWRLVYAPGASVRHPARRAARESISRWRFIVRGFHQVAGRGGYVYGDGRPLWRRFLFPPLRQLLGTAISEPRLAGWRQRGQVLLLSLLKYYVCDLERLRLRLRDTLSVGS